MIELFRVFKKNIVQYASILLAHALYTGAVDEINKDISFLQALLKETPLLDRVLNNPTIPGNFKEQLLKKLCEDRLHLITWKFLTILVNQHQIGKLTLILEAFKDAYQDHVGIKSALLTSATPLSNGLITKLIEKVKQLTGCREVVLKQQINTSIIGGYILQIGSFKLDRSIKHQLNLFQNQLHQFIG